jgi:FXSXX-COOH protein
MPFDVDDLAPVPVFPPCQDPYRAPLAGVAAEEDKPDVAVRAVGSAGHVVGGLAFLEVGAVPGVSGRKRHGLEHSTARVVRMATAPSVIADLRDVPLSEILALGPDILGQAIGRVLPARSETPVPVAAFQSSI